MWTTKIDGPVAIFGDVHGHVDKLCRVLDKVQRSADLRHRWLVFVGDFIDRGPDPRGVMEIISNVRARHPRTTAVCGNHELAMACALGWHATPDYADWPKRWVGHYDSQTTFTSYGAEHGDLAALNAKIPAAHREMIENLPWCVEHPALLVVHAGLDPNMMFGMQVQVLRQRDFSLNNPQWLCAKELVHADPPPDCPVTVVSGHVKVPSVEMRPRRILVDTTGGFHGDLSCVLLPEKQVITSGFSAPMPLQAPPPQRPSFWKRMFG